VQGSRGPACVKPPPGASCGIGGFRGCSVHWRAMCLAHRPAVLVSVSCDFDRAIRVEHWLQLADPAVESWKASFPRTRETAAKLVGDCPSHRRVSKYRPSLFALDNDRESIESAARCAPHCVTA